MENFGSHTYNGTGLKVSRQDENWEIKCVISGNDVRTAYIVHISEYDSELSSS